MLKLLNFTLIISLFNLLSCTPQTTQNFIKIKNDSSLSNDVSNNPLGSNVEPPPQTPFISKWKISKPNESIRLPLGSSRYNYDFTVDWGDGSSDRVTSILDEGRNHTYLKPWNLHD